VADPKIVIFSLYASPAATSYQVPSLCSYCYTLLPPRNNYTLYIAPPTKEGRGFSKMAMKHYDMKIDPHNKEDTKEYTIMDRKIGTLQDS